MNKEVGTENLPNCYIKTIEISNLSKNKNKLIVSVIVKDTENENTLYWYDDVSIAPFLDVVLVASFDRRITNDLNNGRTPIDKRKMNRIFRRDPNYKFISKPVLRQDFKYKREELHNFEYIFTMEVPVSTESLTLFSCVSMDVRRYSLDQKIDLSSNLINSYTGPVTSEIVLQNKNIVEETTAFILPSGEIYSGPVHEHDGKFMEGSYHTDRPHSVLNPRIVSNSKIKDLRSTREFTPLRLNKRRYRVIKGPWLSHNDEGDLYGFFTLDLKNIIISKTFLGEKIARLSDGLFDRLLQDFRFKNIEIFNEKFSPTIKSRRGTPIIAKRRGLKRQSLLKIKQKEPRLKKRKKDRIMLEEMPMSPSIKNRTFSFLHKHNNSVKGHYKYGLEISFVDPTYNFILKIITEMKQTISQFNPYFVRSNRPSSLIKDSTRFSENFVNTELSRFVNEEVAPWNLAILNYINVLSMLKSLSEEEISLELHKATTQAHPKYATPKSLEFFYKNYKKLYSQLVKFFNVRPRNNSDRRGGNTKRQPKNSVSFRIDFKDVVSFEDKDKNLNYFDNNRDGIPLMTKEEFVLNSKKEFNKFFKKKPSFNRTQISTIGKSEATAMSKINNNLVTYMTPKKIKLKKRKIMLNRKPIAFNINEVNDAIDDLKSVKKLEIIKPKKNKKTKFTIRSAKPRQEYLIKGQKKTKDTIKNLGKQSDFNIPQEKNNTKIKKPISKKIKKIFSKKPKIKKKIQKDSFRVSNKIVEKILTNKKRAERLPISLKAVIGSESQSVRNNLLKSRKDQISSRKSADIFDLIYTSPVETQYYNNGKWEIIDVKRLETLKESVVCRIEPFNIQGLTEKEDKINISNKYFILEIDQFNPQMSLTDIKIESVLEKVDDLSRLKDEYYTNNPIKQSPSRIGSLTPQTITQSSSEELVNMATTRIIQRSNNAY